MRKLNEVEVKEMAYNLDMTEEQAKETMETFYALKINNNFRLNHTELDTVNDYIKEYETNWYRYTSFDALVESEKEQSCYGLTEEECYEMLGEAIFKLNCGLYIQSVY
jgi:hypothetical protein